MKSDIKQIVLQLVEKTNRIPIQNGVFDENLTKYLLFTDRKEPTSGVYAFWLSLEGVEYNLLNRAIHLVGPSGKEHFNGTWEKNTKEGDILLYVGKSTNIKKRIGLHLKIKSPSEIWKTEENKIVKPTTCCQVRSGIEHLLKNQDMGVIEFIKKYIRFSYVEENCFQKRFYAEDLAIGEGMPWFNLDSER